MARTARPAARLPVPRLALLGGALLAAMLVAGCGGYPVSLDRFGAGPVLVDGTIVVAEIEGELLGLDPDDGDERWRAEIPLHDDERSAERSPDLVVDIAPVDGGVATLTMHGTVCVHDADLGTQRWCSEAAQLIYLNRDLYSIPHLATSDDVLVVVTRDAELLRFDVQDGDAEVLASLRDPDSYLGLAPDLATDGQLVVTQRTGSDDWPEMTVFDASDGTELWSDGQSAWPTLRIGVSPDGFLVSRDFLTRTDLRTGEVDWSFTPGEDLSSRIRDSMARSAPLLVEDTVVAVIRPTSDRSEVAVVGLEADSGEPRWATDPLRISDHDGDSLVRLVDVGDGTVAVLTQDLTVLDVTDGAVVGTEELGIEHPSQLLVLDGDAIVADSDAVRRLPLPSDAD